VNGNRSYEGGEGTNEERTSEEGARRGSKSIKSSEGREDVREVEEVGAWRWRGGGTPTSETVSIDFCN